VKDLFLKNLGLKFLSIFFAVSLWLFVNLKATAEQDMQLPLRWENLPGILEITNPVNDFVRVRVTGPRRILSNLNPRNYPVVLDLSDAQAGLMDYQITEKMVSLIPGLKVDVLPPDKVQFKFDLIVTAEVPVRPVIVGKPPAGYELARMEVEPKRIEIVGAQSEIMGVDHAGTRAIDVADLREDREEYVSIALKRPHIRPAKGQERVRVRLFVTEQEIGKWFRLVGVELEPNPGGAFTIQPAAVDIYLKGPAGKVMEQKPEDLHAWIRVPEEEGEIFSQPVILQGQVEGLQAEIRPPKVLLKRLPSAP
jgi:hypothetical protein